MTLSALIEDKIFCTHGGIASEAKAIDDVTADKNNNRSVCAPLMGLFVISIRFDAWTESKKSLLQVKCVNCYGTIQTKKAMATKKIKEGRLIRSITNIFDLTQTVFCFLHSMGKTFGKDVFQQFIYSNNLTKVVRAHQLVMEGSR